MIVIPASLRSDFTHMARMTIHIAHPTEATTTAESVCLQDYRLIMIICLRM
jgi:hypothetical protein